jgi:pyruvate dehydrogenase E1 component alpha subunit
VNLAAVWNLPVLFVCENNGYAFSTRQQDHQRNPNIADRAAAYGLPGQVVDGNDVDAVWAAVRPAVDSARAGHGPILFDAKTYRWYGQYDADDRPRSIAGRNAVPSKLIALGSKHEAR